MDIATRAAPHLHVATGPVVMDLHSDSGLDFGDDIDLELQSPARQDDVMSVNDAGYGPQMNVVDQDDFMVDHEDLIDLDEGGYTDGMVADAREQPPTVRDPVQEQDVAHAEDDLIDYSDDEEQPALLKGGAATQPTNFDRDDPEAVHHEDFESIGRPQSTEPGQGVVDDEASRQEQPKYATEHTQGIEHDEDSDPTGYRSMNEDEVYANAGGVELVEHGESVEVVPHGVHQNQGEPDSDIGTDGTTRQQETPDQAPQDVRQHPVTVNYNGAELWLFKKHDYDDTGDYLVEDSSLVTQPISSLIDACRAALGPDIAEEIELGLRLDHLQNIDLYQEHSSCAFISLEHLVSVYLQLHAQDGVVEPESFYMTLLFRPRISTLLNEISKAAAEGIGQSGLNKAIASGLTAFDAPASHKSTDDDDNWGNSFDEQEQRGQNEQEHEERDHEEDKHGEYQEQESKEFNALDDNGSSAHEAFEKSTQSAAQTPSEAHPSLTDDVAYPAASGVELEALTYDANAVKEQPASDQPRSSSAHASQAEDDYVDYSDDEVDAEADTANGNAQATHPSTSSSTVQGDEQSHVGDDAQDVQEAEELPKYGEDGVSYEDEVDDNLAQSGSPNEFQEQSYRADSQENVDEALVGGNGYAQELEGFSNEYTPQGNDEDTNHYDFGHETVDQHPLKVSASEADETADTANYPVTTDNNFTKSDDFLDFDDVTAPEIVSQLENNSLPATLDVYDEIAENDATSQAPVAASAALDVSAASSSKVLNQSPSAQKRPIDEVSNDVNETFESADAKRPRV